MNKKRREKTNNYLDLVINPILLVLFIYLATNGIDDMTANYKIKETVNNIKELRIALEEYYQLTGGYPDLTKDGANQDLTILDYKDSNGNLISFAKIYGKKTLEKTYGNKDLVATNKVYDVQNFEKGTLSGGWNYNYTGKTGEIHPNLPDDIYVKKINWNKQ